MAAPQERPAKVRRRWPFVVVALVAVVSVSAAAWWFVWVPRWRPALRDGERLGVDVSAHQGRVDWSRVADDGITFAYLKATEGGDRVDARFRQNWAGAVTAGLARGAYHYFTLCRPGLEQARNFLATAPPDPSALAPAVDLELAGNCDARPTRRALDRELDAFIQSVEQAWGRTVLLYVGDDFDRRYPGRRHGSRALWRRRFLLRPDVPGWTVWQASWFAHVDGITGHADLDVMRRPPT